MQILHASFRELAPGDGTATIAPVAATASRGETVEIGRAADSASYRLMRHSNELLDNA